MAQPDSTDEESWEAWWDDRLVAMVSVLGNHDGQVSHSPVPFEFGYDAGGRADVVHFREHVAGVVYATCELIGCDEQVKNSLGNYELAICHRGTERWGAELISRLAYYTLEAQLEPGSTMDLGPAVRPGSAITAFLFVEFGRFRVRDRAAGLLLCIGITADELAHCRNHRRAEVEAALISKGVYPFTDLERGSVFV
ncbi:hypothetical protein FRZ44_23090 [Hypericibacter terrae]|uniref:Suppressor of fused-like domain-containing protein n=1 Tax=Hypericibacter terrae TaxID=2602015 RepID=A0A5J6MHM8_9PROT|nr:suppressor of fused domain protein [Hypericibacter terrae]QEX17013.1 hypothetical protein FRZ44_23090 [Hypericibacter terrae]